LREKIRYTFTALHAAQTRLLAKTTAIVGGRLAMTWVAMVYAEPISVLTLTKGEHQVRPDQTKEEEKDSAEGSGATGSKILGREKTKGPAGQAGWGTGNGKQC
jgi:hypothetical protein